MKRRLLSFAVLLMTVWGTQNMFAQLDVTSYIINADFLMERLVGRILILIIQTRILRCMKLMQVGDRLM